MEQSFEIDPLSDPHALTQLLVPPKGEVTQVVETLPLLAPYEELFEVDPMSAVSITTTTTTTNHTSTSARLMMMLTPKYACPSQSCESRLVDSCSAA